MKEDNKQIGVITEQGFVAGYGLGFNTLNEQDREKIKDKEDKDKDNKD